MCVYYMTGTPEGSTESGFIEKWGFEPATPGFHSAYPLHHGGFSDFSRFLLMRQYFTIVCGRVPWLYQYWPGGFMLYVVLCPGTPEGSTGSGSGFKASQETVLYNTIHLTDFNFQCTF